MHAQRGIAGEAEAKRDISGQARGSDDEQLVVYRAVRDAIRARIEAELLSQ